MQQQQQKYTIFASSTTKKKKKIQTRKSYMYVALKDQSWRDMEHNANVAQCKRSTALSKNCSGNIQSVWEKTKI